MAFNLSRSHLPILQVFIIAVALIAQTTEAAESAGIQEKNPKLISLMTAQQELRRTFLEETHTQAKLFREKIDSAQNKIEKDNILEEFRKSRLREVHEFQKEDTLLQNEIETLRKAAA